MNIAIFQEEAGLGSGVPSFFHAALLKESAGVLVQDLREEHPHWGVEQRGGSLGAA